MAEETLRTVVLQLRKNQKANTEELEFLNAQIMELGNSFNTMFAKLNRSFRALMMDNLEKSREAKRSAGKTAAAGGGASVAVPMIPTPGAFTQVLGGLLAVGAALSGLRGWEIDALKHVKRIGRALRLLIPGAFIITAIQKAMTPGGYTSLTDFITKKFNNLRIGILKALGFDMTLKKFNDPKSGLKVGLFEQIKTGLTNLRSSLLTRIYGMMGLGVDGKPIVAQGPGGKFAAKELSIVGKITKGISALFAPLVTVANGLTDFIANNPIMVGVRKLGLIGAAAVTGPFGKAIGGIGFVFKRVLWPIGILFSLFKGVEAFINTDGSFFQKAVAGIFGFLSDLIGAPLNLFKSLFTFALKKLGIGVDENGKFKEGTLGAALEEFDFVEMIKSIPKLIASIFNHVLRIFQDPVGVAKDVFVSIKGFIKGFFSTLINYFNPFKSEEKSEAEKMLEKTKKALTGEQFSLQKSLEQQKLELRRANKQELYGVTQNEMAFYEMNKKLEAAGKKIKNPSRYERVKNKIESAGIIRSDINEFRNASIRMLNARNVELTNSLNQIREEIKLEEAMRKGDVTTLLNNQDNSSTVNNSNLLSEGATSPKDVADNAELYSVD